MVDKLRSAWDKMENIPGGKKVFSKVLGQLIPYTGSVKAEIVEISAGYAKLKMKDRRSVRNHLKSIHAAAIMNFAEIASGLALNFSLDKGMRAILVNFDITYTKKARGTLHAECHWTEVVKSLEEDKKYTLSSNVSDASGSLVAEAKATWLVGPIPKRGKVT